MTTTDHAWECPHCGSRTAIVLADPTAPVCCGCFALVTKSAVFVPDLERQIPDPDPFNGADIDSAFEHDGG